MPLNIQDIHLLDNPLLDVFRSLKTTNFARDAGLFVAEGPTVVERVLRSGFSIHSLLVSDRKWQWFHDETEKGLLSAAKGIRTFPVFRMQHQLAEQLAGFAFHSGVLVAAYRRPALSVDALLTKETSAVFNDAPTLLLAGDRIVDPENVGALIRIAAAFGAAGVIFGPGSADPFSRRVLRVSMGNVLFLPVLDSSDLTSTLTVLKTKHDFRICATSLNLAARTLSTYHFHPRTVLVFGNEYDGISAETSAISDVSLTIPMLNGTDSLNVSVSAGICAYQYRIQHGAPQLSGSFTDRPVREA